MLIHTVKRARWYYPIISRRQLVVHLLVLYIFRVLIERRKIKFIFDRNVAVCAPIATVTAPIFFAKNN